MNGVVITILAFVILGAGIAYVEINERRGKGKGAKNVTCPGTITKISERPAYSGRALFKWDVEVSFEYEGMTYTLELHYPNRPNVEVGKTVTVEVNTKDPRNSNCNLY